MRGVGRGIVGSLLLAASGAACGGAEVSAPPEDPRAYYLEVSNWLFSGREGEAMNALFAVLRRREPRIELANHIPEPDTRQDVIQRFKAHNPPDSQQVIEGGDVGGWVALDAFASLDSTAAADDWPTAFPKAVLDSVSVNGSLYAAPLTIERDNTLFFNKELFAAHALSPPTSIAAVVDAASALSVKGVTGLSMSGYGWAVASMFFDAMLVAEAGPDFYQAYLTGQLTADAAEVQRALADLAKLVDYANADLATTGWGDAVHRLCSGEAAMLMMPDFVKSELDRTGCFDPAKIGYLTLEPPGAPTFVFIGLGFALAKEALHPLSGTEFVRTVGSREGQEAFNLLKLTVPARVDADMSQFDPISAAEVADYRALGEHHVLGYVGLTPAAFQENVNAALEQFVDATSPNYKNVSAVLETLRSQYPLLRP